MPAPEQTQMTPKEWFAEGRRLFGDDPKSWRFVCPACGHVASWSDWASVGAPEGAVGFDCVGRWIDGSRSAFYDKGDGPCDYTGGGLFKLNPVRVSDDAGQTTTFFAFAEAA